MRSGFFVPVIEDMRRVKLEIYRAHPRRMEERNYQEYFGSDIPDERGGRYYSDVTEYLDDRHIGHAEAMAIIDRDIQSIVIGIPTYDNVHNHAERIRYLETVHVDLKLLKHSNSQYRDSPVELVINVNGLDDGGNPQEQFLDDILQFQSSHSTVDVPITVMHMPLGGRSRGDRLPGKSNAVNAIAEYAKGNGASIMGIMDDDIDFSPGNILSNIEFLMATARSLQSPILTGSSFESLAPQSPWGKWLASYKVSGCHSVRGTSMFSFLFSFPPLPSFPISEDLYLAFYYADETKNREEMLWRIHSNPQAKIYFRLADTFWGSLRQKSRFELCDLWTLSLLGDRKRKFRYPRYGYSLLQTYLSTTIEARDLKQTIANVSKTLPEFLFRNLLINHILHAELWLRQFLHIPRCSTYWSRTVSASTKRVENIDHPSTRHAERSEKGPSLWTLAQRGE